MQDEVQAGGATIAQGGMSREVGDALGVWACNIGISWAAVG
jgi:hypothetical protein